MINQLNSAKFFDNCFHMKKGFCRECVEQLENELFKLIEDNEELEERVEDLESEVWSYEEKVNDLEQELSYLEDSYVDKQAM